MRKLEPGSTSSSKRATSHIWNAGMVTSRSALEYYRETIIAFRDMAQIGAVSHQLECFGFIALAKDQDERALQLFAAANIAPRKSAAHR